VFTLSVGHAIRVFVVKYKGGWGDVGKYQPRLLKDPSLSAVIILKSYS
jgi:hypothetical protein